MICDRCNKLIRDDEEYIVEAVGGATAVGSDIYLHEPLCQRPSEVERPRTYPRQTRYAR